MIDLEIDDEVFDVFKELLRLPADIERDVLAYNETDNWDSVGHMGLVFALEERFDIMIDTEDVLDMSNFAKAVAIVKRHQ